MISNRNTTTAYQQGGGSFIQSTRGKLRRHTKEREREKEKQTIKRKNAKLGIITPGRKKNMRIRWKIKAVDYLGRRSL